MKMADEGYGNSVREKLSIGENVRTFWYRTDENGAYTEITVNENFENFTAAIEQDNDYLELTDVDPDPQESYLAYWVVRPGMTRWRPCRSPARSPAARRKPASLRAGSSKTAPAPRIAPTTWVRARIMWATSTGT